MRKPLIVPLAFAFALSSGAAGVTGPEDPAHARLEESPRHQEWVSIPSGDHAVDTYVVYPERAGKALAVLVIHENRGLTDWVRSVADRLAEKGYVALAPDLLTGKAPGGGRTDKFPDSDAARTAIYALDANTVLADLRAVAVHAREIPAADGRLAVVGFCWGGSQTWRVAAAGGDLVLAAPFYGTAPEDEAAFKTIAGPVFGFYGGADERVNATLERTTAAMKAAGKTFEPEIYDGAGHAFMRAGEAGDATPANRKAMEEGWKRLLEKLASAGGDDDPPGAS